MECLMKRLQSIQSYPLKKSKNLPARNLPESQWRWTALQVRIYEDTVIALWKLVRPTAQKEIPKCQESPFFVNDVAIRISRTRLKTPGLGSFAKVQVTE